MKQFHMDSYNLSRRKRELLFLKSYLYIFLCYLLFNKGEHEAYSNTKHLRPSQLEKKYRHQDKHNISVCG